MNRILRRIGALPLALKLGLPFAAAAFVPLLALAFVEVADLRRPETEARIRLRAAANYQSTRIAIEIAYGVGVAGAAAADPAVESLSQTPEESRLDAERHLRPALAMVSGAHVSFAELVVLDRQGRVILSSNGGMEKRPAPEALRAALTSPPGTLPPISVSRGRVLPCTAPIRGGGAVVTLLDLDALAKLVPSGVSGPDSVGQLVTDDSDGAIRRISETLHEPVVAEHARVAGTSALGVVYAEPRSTVAVRADRRIRAVISAGLAATILAILVGALITLRFGRRFRKLELAVRSAAEGDLEAPIAVGPPDEIGRVAEAWQATRLALSSARADLAAAHDDLKRHMLALEARVEERTRELAQKSDHLARIAEEAKGLAEAASALGRETDVLEVTACLAESAKSLLGVDICVVFLANDQRTELSAMAPVPKAREGLETERVLVSDTISAVARSFRERRTVAVAVGAGSSRSGVFVAGLGARSCFAVPILAGEDALGVFLAGFTTRGRLLSESDLSLVETIAAEAGIAIDRAAVLTRLAERERDLHDLIDKAGDLIFAYGAGGKFTRANQRVVDTLGYSLEELQKLSYPDLCAPAEDGGADASRLAETSKVLETVLVAKDGRRVPLELRTRTVRRNGRVIEIQAIGRDLGERRELERRDLEATRLKTAIELAGAAAHNLNQPLTGILGFADMLLASPEDPGAKEMIREIRTQAARMAEILRKMKTLTRFETESYVGSARIAKL